MIKEKPKPENKEQQKQLQQKYMELQMLSQQLMQIKKQLELLSSQIEDLNLTMDALKNISKTEPGTEILVPLASGIFIKAALSDSRETLVNVGAGTAVSKTVSETEALISQQLKEVSDFRAEMESSANNLKARAAELEKEFSELTGDSSE